MGRFVAIFAITALGAGFFAGLKATGPDMRATGDAYYRDTRLMDVRVFSTLGLTDNDVAALRAEAGVGSVMAGYAADLLVEHPEGTEVVHFEALPADTAPENMDYLNRPVLEEGRLPEAADECVVDSAGTYRLGDVLAVSGENEENALDRMAQRQFTVVGRVRSPVYVAFQRGNTNIGNGRVAFFAYVRGEAFVQDVYTVAYLRLSASDTVSSFAAEYDAQVDDAAARLEALGDTQSAARYDELVAEGEAALADAEQELADARQQVADGQKELKDGRGELEDARREADEKLAEARDALADAERALADGQREIDENTAKLADAEAGITSGQEALNAARATLEAGQADYAAGQAAWDKAQKEWQAANTAYVQALAQYEAGAAQLAGLEQAGAGLQQAAATLGQLLQAMQAGAPEAEVQFTQVAQGAAQSLRQLADTLAAAGLPGGEALNTAAEQMEAALAAGDYPLAAGALAAVPDALEPVLAGVRGELATAKAELDAAKAELDAGKTALDKTERQLGKAWRELEAGQAAVNAGEWELAVARGQVADGHQALAAAQQKLADGRRALEEGRVEYATQEDEVAQELADAEQELADGEAELHDAQEKLADAEAQLADGQRALNELEPGEWIVQTRGDNPGYSGFASDAQRIDAIAAAIPVFFFLVAALVCLTTMTRMVEEQRTLIGTLKAMGYGRGSIAMKYVGYAALASTGGAVAGVALGFALFPWAIWQAYRMLYLMPDLSSANNGALAVASVAASVLCTTLAALGACINELRSVPAQLLRRKAPKAGKRVFLEHIGPVWRRMSFMQKVTARNLMRYKKRFFMTVIGVAGCTALLLTGFGLRDSIRGIVSRQYGSIDVYDMVVALSTPGSAHDDSALNAVLPQLGEGLYVNQKLVDAKSDGGDSAGMSVYVVVPEEPGRMGDFIRLVERKSGQAVDLPAEGAVVLSEKLAGRLKVDAGDSISVNRPGEKAVRVPVAGVAENYVLSYVYMAPETYAALFGEAAAYDTVLLNLFDAAASEGAASQLLEVAGVAGAVEISAMRGQFDDMFASLDSVVWLIIAAAGMLAFVVLYNLTNINITERSREIATLKVLGFRNGEVAGYVYRENLILTLIGMLLGLFLGIFLHQFVVVTAEVDEVMFRRVIEPLSYVWGGVFTLVAAGLVNVVMLPRLRRVDMVESLKAGE
ncbi:MAG: FtsX-like permease family protein [Oscillospiraceae bacterium]